MISCLYFVTISTYAHYMGGLSPLQYDILYIGFVCAFIFDIHALAFIARYWLRVVLR